MPKPRYIVCSEQRLVDQVTGLASHINVVDRFEIREVRQELPADVRPDTQMLIPKLPIAHLVMTASWVKEPPDNDKDVFEFETVLRRPDGTSDVIHRGEFPFGKQRFFWIDTGVVFTTHTKFSASGELVFESRIRKQGSQEWLSQAFPVDVEVVAVAEESPTNTANQ